MKYMTVKNDKQIQIQVFPLIWKIYNELNTELAQVCA